MGTKSSFGRILCLEGERLMINFPEIFAIAQYKDISQRVIWRYLWGKGVTCGGDEKLKLLGSQ